MAEPKLPHLVAFECPICRKILGEFSASARVSHAPCKAQARPVMVPVPRSRVSDCAG